MTNPTYRHNDVHVYVCAGLDQDVDSLSKLSLCSSSNFLRARRIFSFNAAVSVRTT